MKRKGVASISQLLLVVIYLKLFCFLNLMLALIKNLVSVDTSGIDVGKIIIAPG